MKVAKKLRTASIIFLILVVVLTRIQPLPLTVSATRPCIPLQNTLPSTFGNPGFPKCTLWKGSNALQLTPASAPGGSDGIGGPAIVYRGTTVEMSILGTHTQTSGIPGLADGFLMMMFPQNNSWVSGSTILMGCGGQTGPAISGGPNFPESTTPFFALQWEPFYTGPSEFNLFVINSNTTSPCNTPTSTDIHPFGPVGCSIPNPATNHRINFDMNYTSNDMLQTRISDLDQASSTCTFSLDLHSYGFVQPPVGKYWAFVEGKTGGAQADWTLIQGSVPPGAVGDPANVWAPYGPFVKNLWFNFSSNPYDRKVGEFANFRNGWYDVAGSSVPYNLWSAYSTNPDFLLTPDQNSSTYYGLSFNAGSSLFTNTTAPGSPYWGCNWDTGSDFSKAKQTFAATCGREMRLGFARLPQYFSAPPSGLSQICAPTGLIAAPTATCSTSCFDSTTPGCTYGYHSTNNDCGSGLAATYGCTDFCVAADHMIAAGLATGKDNRCVLQKVNPNVFAHPLRFYYRSDDSNRVALANAFSLAMNQLFGGWVVTLVSTQNCQLVVCGGPPYGGLIDDWDVYTFDHTPRGVSPDDLIPLYVSSYASNYCGGLQKSQPSNYGFVCLTTIDNDFLGGSVTTTFTDFGQSVIEVPLWVVQVRTVALGAVGNGYLGMAGLVNENYNGYANYWTMLNAEQGSYQPKCQGKSTTSCPSGADYRFGRGDATTLRWGQPSPTFQLNIFNAESDSELNVMGEVYDTLFRASPIQSDHVICWMCNSALTITPYVSGDVMYDVILKQNLRFHNGTSVTAHDVAFSALNLARYGATLGASLQRLRGVQVISNNEVYIEWQGVSSSVANFMEFPILPSSFWEDTTATVPGSCAPGCVWGSGQGAAGDTSLIASNIHPVKVSKLDLSYDPTSAAEKSLVGSGPFVCESMFSLDQGRIGTGCVADPAGGWSGQGVKAGGTVRLKVFDFTGQPGNGDGFYQFVRSYNVTWGTGTSSIMARSGQFQEFKWSDYPSRNAVVTTLDLLSVSQCYGASAPTGATTGACPMNDPSTGIPIYSHWAVAVFDNPPGTISVFEVAIVQVHVDDTWVSPFTWNSASLTNIVPYP